MRIVAKVAWLLVGTACGATSAIAPHHVAEPVRSADLERAEQAEGLGYDESRQQRVIHDPVRAQQAQLEQRKAQLGSGFGEVSQNCVAGCADAAGAVQCVSGYRGCLAVLSELPRSEVVEQCGIELRTCVGAAVPADELEACHARCLTSAAVGSES